MKWIGQHIYDLASRFRNDVFLEDISTGTIASGAHLGLDSNNKIVKAVDGGGDLTSIVAGTGLSGTSLTGPIPTLNVDASQPSITTLAGVTAIGTAGNPLTVTSDQVIFASAAASDPLVNIQNTANDASAPRLRFTKNRGGDAVDNDNVGEISFHSYDDGTPSTQEYARIKAQVHDATSDEESGSLQLMVANHDGGVQAGLSIVGGDVDSEIDVNLGLGAASTTTVAGTLTMGSTATLNNTGILQAAAQTNITSLGTLSSLAVTSASDLGSAAMTLTNADVDQIALNIAASNTTGSVINVDSHSLNAGKMFEWDYNDARTNSSNNFGFYADIDKTGVVASGQSTMTTAYYANFLDGATNVGTSHFTGFEVFSDDVNDDGTNVRTAFKGTVTDGDANTTFGLYLKIQDGGKELLFQSSEDTGDQAHWITTTNGATTITTVDDDGEAAHFEIAADGNITLDAAGDIALETVGGDITSDANLFAISSDAPVIRLQSKINNATAAVINFDKNQYLSGGEAGVADDDLIGTILWTGTDNALQLVQYASIVASISEANHTDEAGKLEFKVAESDGTTTALTTGLTLEGEHATDGQIDVTIAAGAASTTTVSGTLTMGSTAFVNNSGVIQVATQGTIDHDSLANFVTAEHVDWAGASAGTIHSTNIPTLNQNTTGTAATVTGAAQTNITSLGTLTNLTVDNINLNSDKITIIGDTDDTFIITTGAAGATTLTTVDTAGADGHLAMVADGNITLKPDAGGDFQVLKDDGTASLIVTPNTNTNFQSLGRGALFGPANAASSVINRSTSPHDTVGGEMSIQAGSTTAGTTDNIAGGNLIIAGGQGKGSGAGGDIIFKTANAGSSGSTLNALATAMTISDDLSTTLAGAVTSTGTLTTGGTIELGHASDTTIARSAAGTATIEGNQIVTTGVPKGNTFQISCPTYISLYVFYMNTQNYWYTPPMYNTQVDTSTAIGSMNNLSVTTQARAANYVAPRACKVKAVSMVFKQASSFLSGDINLEFQLIKWTPNDDASGSVAVTDMAITDHAGAFTENDVHSLIFTVTDNADAALAANDCFAFCARTTSAPGSGTTVRNLVYGAINFEIEIT